MPDFQEATLPGVRLSCRPHGYDLLRCPCRCLSLLIHYVAFATVTMWAGLPEPRDWRCLICSNNIVLCVVRGLEPSLPLFLAISSQVRQRPHYYLVTLLSRLMSSPVRLLTRYLLHLSYDWSLCLAQLTPACGVTSFRFVQAATALPVISILSLCCLCWLWVRVILCCFLSFSSLFPQPLCFSMS